MTGIKETVYKPNKNTAYGRLYKLYKELHDAFGVKGCREPSYHIMKELIDIRDSVRNK
jgi:L-ribulokinase